MSRDIPPFTDLPIDKTGPYLNAWGLYGKDDQLGFLNRITDTMVKEAASSEIKTGTRISLNWALDAQGSKPFFNRQAFHQSIIPKHPRIVNDDIWSFNTQSSSQWDGLRHFAYQESGQFYNGVTMDDIHNNNSDINGIGAWSKKGIVGRGILLDYPSWLQQTQQQSQQDVFATTPITLSDLRSVLAHQNLSPKFGDILLIRSGYLAAYSRTPASDLDALADVNPPHLVGLEQSDDVLAWIWAHFSAVAGDQPAFECWPSRRSDYSLHEVLLAGWGCPIGELFDLEDLAAKCKELGRYSFFVSSEPCNVPGGVASPPNILAIF